MARPHDDDSLSLETPRPASAWPVPAQPTPPQPGATPPDATQPAVPGPTATRPERKSNRRRTILLSATGVVLVLCLAGTMAAYFTYDRATKLDRSQPYVTLYQYLEYGWNQHDPDRAKLFRCKDPKLGPLEDLFADLSNREQQYDVTFEVQAANKPVQYSGDTAIMNTNLILLDPTKAVTPREVDPWEFRFRNEGGWRLCG